MQEDYYQNILYPLQDKVLEIVGSLPVEFYLTGGTALSRAYLNHRHSDDLDFFLNRAQDFKQQVNEVIRAFSTWEEIFDDASQKDLWVNPVNIAEILEKFPVQKLQEIPWAGQIPSDEWFMSRVNRIIPDILDGGSNSLFKA